METDYEPAPTKRRGKGAFFLIPCIWGSISIALAVVSFFCLSESEWFPRAFVAAIQTFFMGGIIPMLFARIGTLRNTESILWYLCISGYAVCTLMAQEDVFLYHLWAIVPIFLFILQTVRAPRHPVTNIMAGLILASVLIFSCLKMRSSLPMGERIFQAYGCFLCHGSAQNMAKTFDFLNAPSSMARERLYLHFYAPQLAKNAQCPPIPTFFVRKDKQPGEYSPWALPVKISDDEEIVPTARARALADFLLALRPPISMGNNRNDLIARGESLFYAKCAACHGRNGLGDEVNYPPLTDIAKYKNNLEELRHLILNGKSGIITVHGREWNSSMRPPGITGEADTEAVLLYLQERFMP